MGTRWILEVVNVQTGIQVILRKVEEMSTSFDTSVWESGIYLIQAKIGKDILSEKIMIK